MEVHQVHRGRLIDHLQLVVADFDRSRAFYAAVLEVLGVPVQGDGPGFFWADELVISSTDSPAAQGKLTGPTHFAFQADDREIVEQAYAAGLAAGGKDNGAPGVRPYHPDYFAAFLLDPDGNNVEVVYHGPGRRSADSVVIDF